MEAKYLPLGRAFEVMVADVEFNAILEDRAKRLYTYILAANSSMSPAVLSGVKKAILDFYLHLQPKAILPPLGPMGALCAWIEDADESQEKRIITLSILLDKVRKMLEGECGFHRA